MNKLMAVVFIGVLLIGCNGIVKQDVREFIEGSYVRLFQNEVAVGVDSVVLSAAGENNYLILKYSRFSRIQDNGLLPEEIKQEKMMGVFDEEKKVINEVKKGKVLSFHPNERKLFIGGSEYRKVR